MYRYPCEDLMRSLYINSLLILIKNPANEQKERYRNIIA